MIGATGRGLPGRSRATSARHLLSDRYFFFLAADFFAARKEIPARIAFCRTAAAGRPSSLATWLVGVPALASCFRVRSSAALQPAPSFEGRFAINSNLQSLPTTGIFGMIAGVLAARAPNMVY